MTSKLDTAGLVERQDNRITQKYLRRYPNSKRTRSWAGVLVHIETENGVWRKGGSGYTYAGRDDAWVLPFEEAQRHVAHCGPEKRAAFIRAKALTQAAAPDMEPVAWQSRFSPTGKWAYDPYGFDPEFRAKSEAAGAQWRALYSASQLSALQKRVERAERERDEAMGARNENAKLRGQRDAALAKLEAAEARVAELEALIQNHGSAKLIRLSGAALAHKGEER